MWAYYMMHEIRVWWECTLSAQLITDALWMGRHGFTESATITHLSHFVSSVCIVLPGWAWKTNYQVISQRSSSTPRWAAGSLPIYSEGWIDRWTDETNSLYRISPSNCHSSATSTKSGFSPPAVPHCSSSHHPANWQEVISLSGFASFCGGVKLTSPAGKGLWPLCAVRQEPPSTCSHFLPNSPSFLSHFSSF